MLVIVAAADSIGNCCRSWSRRPCKSIALVIGRRIDRSFLRKRPLNRADRAGARQAQLKLERNRESERKINGRVNGGKECESPIELGGSICSGPRASNLCAFTLPPIFRDRSIIDNCSVGRSALVVYRRFICPFSPPLSCFSFVFFLLYTVFLC